MAVPVINLLKVIHVQQKGVEGVAALDGALYLVGEILEHAAPVVQLGQRVGGDHIAVNQQHLQKVQTAPLVVTAAVNVE